MEYLIHFILSFIATACFGVIFNASVKAIPICGLVGSVGWTVYYTFMQVNVTEVHATFLASFVIAVVAQFFARWFKTPMIVFYVSGIIPLVPGSIAYNTMRSIVELDYTRGIEFGMRAFMIAGAIAMGLVFAEVIIQLIYRTLNKGKTSMESFAKLKRPRIK
ncbi:threonine/serine exporter family protein [Ureibacillus manganicus]|uniref:Membrane protein n=1 Tax=Ureibacillus manganicus DSM 26584 TaxID=1384049 RepID=A0A0A3I793_9BACL|nr:threonine/serine exporter family protein [Ureibacillus manganicus]KGR79370.1 membrane protein [Ureibacillus manganicus DSM 26584]